MSQVYKEALRRIADGEPGPRAIAEEALENGSSPGSPGAGSYGADLFETRTPEAAARQLATVLAWMAECELATLARYERLKSSSKNETERHREICNRLVRHCAELGVDPRGFSGAPCPRLKEQLEEYNAP